MKFIDTRSYNEVEAIQYLGHNLGEVNKLVGEWLEPSSSTMELPIKTLEGDVVAESGDWVIVLSDGDVIVHRPDIFKVYYTRWEGK